MAQKDQVTVPGQYLGPVATFHPGPGTHVAEGLVYASLLGHIQIDQAATGGGGPSSTTSAAAMAARIVQSKRLTRITVPTSLDPQSQAGQQSLAKPTVWVSREDIAHGGETLPQVGDVVLCRVTRMSQRQAVVAILVVGNTVLDTDWQGLIRVQDVRATEKDRVKIFESFRPGDIVRAGVISLGDQANYYLSTASNPLGVVMATSEAGNAMYPVNWKEYADPETGLRELRKVAKPF